LETAVEDLCWFGVKQAVACAFPVGFFLVLGLSRVVEVPGLARYDRILLTAVLLRMLHRGALVATGAGGGRRRHGEPNASGSRGLQAERPRRGERAGDGVRRR
jgi:hypothetical protein